MKKGEFERELSQLLKATPRNVTAIGNRMLAKVAARRFENTIIHASVLYTYGRALYKLKHDVPLQITLLEGACEIFESLEKRDKDWLADYFDISAKLVHLYFQEARYDDFHNQATKIILLPAIGSAVEANYISKFWTACAQAYDHLCSYPLAVAAAEMALQIHATSIKKGDAVLLKQQDHLNSLYEQLDAPRSIWKEGASPNTRLCFRCHWAVSVAKNFLICPTCENAVFCSRECSEPHLRQCGVVAPAPLRRIDIRSRSKCMACFRVRAPQCCAKCRRARYCDVDCQRANWAIHRSLCAE